MSYDYKKNVKLCTGTTSPNQLNTKGTTKNNKNHRLQFLKGTKLVIQMTPIFVYCKKKARTYKKRDKFAKIMKIDLMKTGCSKKKDNLKNIKPLGKENYISKDKLCQLYTKMLSYNIAQKIADLKNLFFY